MLLRRLVLHNIRSYTDAAIEFPEGIVLLSGDIGAGKSTVLLAIEFALFGIQRAELSGAALLRHGENAGWVELRFEIDKEAIEIVRTLKRQNGTITQDSGYIMRNGLRQDCTATELKAIVLELLGYPADMLTKGKNVLFRYTVYTPQEEMKRILEESSDERLMTLRRLFNIEKYERIQENTRVVLSSLRDKEKELDGQLSQLPSRQAQFMQLEESAKETSAHLEEITPQLQARRLKVMECKTAINENQEKLNTLFAIKREIMALEAQERVQSAQVARLERENAVLAKDISATATPTETTPPTLLLAARRESEQAIADIEKAILADRTQLASINTRATMSASTLKSIESLDVCPTCKQQVARDHRVRIISEETSRREALATERVVLEKRLVSLQEQLSKRKQTLETARMREQQAAVAVMQQKLVEEKRARLASNTDQLIVARDAVRLHKEQTADASGRLAALGDIEALHKGLTQQLDAAIEAERQTSIVHARLLQQSDAHNAQLEQLRSELLRLENTRARRGRTIAVRDWVGNSFAPLIGSIESHVFAAVHHEFDSLFIKWYSLLIDDSLLSARIAKDFGIALQQNGYDTAFEHLSGGERTAIALAYRLSLNRVVNDLVDTINTQDLLILDEPTDGFSAEQLQKVRDVLRELNCKQILLVSHEAALESFVDSVLRVQKSEHASTIG